MKEIIIELEKESGGYLAKQEGTEREFFALDPGDVVEAVLTDAGFWDDDAEESEEEALELYEFKIDTGSTNLANEPGPFGDGHKAERSAWQSYQGSAFSLYRASEDHYLFGKGDEVMRTDTNYYQATREEAVLWVVDGVRPEGCWFYGEPGHE